MFLDKLFMTFMGCLGLCSNPQKEEENDTKKEENDTKKEEKKEESLLSSSSSSSSSSCDDDVASVGAPRVRLNDGRYLAYIEKGVPKEICKYKLIIVHGFGSSKEMNFLVSQDLMDELGLYVLLFDRAGYEESDPNPKRSVKTEATDIEELANQLNLGPKFYLLGVSLGGYPVWSCINRIPERLAGVALVVPTINYNWPSLPRDLVKDDYRKKLTRLAVFVAKYIPGLVHWWMTQEIFPSSTVLDKNPTFYSDKDMEMLKNTPGYQLLSQNKLKDKAVFDCLRRDFIVAFSKWDFDPLELPDPYPKNESFVHIWQGYEDRVIPFPLQRFVSKKLPWIKYHEVPEGGHFLLYDLSVCEDILRSLLLEEDLPLYRPKSFN